MKVMQLMQILKGQDVSRWGDIIEIEGNDLVAYSYGIETFRIPMINEKGAK